MAMNFCSNCGAKLRAGAKFCGSCGQKIFVEPQKSLAERYAETKAQVQAAPPKVELKKSEPPKTMTEIFAEAKRNAPPPQAPWMKNPPPQPPPTTYTPSNQPPPQPTYTPPEDTTPHYKEDETFQEMFLTSNGRLNRMRYFKRTLAVDLIYLLAALIIASSCSTPWGDITQTGDALIMIVAVIALIPKFHLDVRRLKDSAMFDNESSIQMFAGFVAIISLAYMFMSAGWDFSSPMPPLVKGLSFAVLLAWARIQFPAGTVGPNKYGADPLENERR